MSLKNIHRFIKLIKLIFSWSLNNIQTFSKQFVPYSLSFESKTKNGLFLFISRNHTKT